MQSLRILLVDDNVDCVETLAELLRYFGHQVATAHDGPAGLARFESFRPELVILDIGLPGLDGYEVARQLRRGREAVPLIALTAYDSPEHRQRALDVGFDHHLAKPPNWPQLHALVIAYGIKVHRAARSRSSVTGSAVVAIDTGV